MNDIKILTGADVQHIQTSRIVLNKGQTCAFDMVVRTYNYCKHSFYEKAGLLTDEQGRLLIDESFQVEEGLGLFAIGESGRFSKKKLSREHIDTKQQIGLLAKNMEAFLNGKPLKKISLFRLTTTFIPLGGPYAMIIRGEKAIYGKWCLKLLRWINQRFMKRLLIINK